MANISAGTADTHQDLLRSQFDDEEQYVKLQDTVDLLVAAGYFRARLKSLPPFDKVVGGMVWCITLCSQSIDVDLFYSENSTIGQQIALIERVVEVLPQLRCPHTIEPHQIQGLDFIHIFPVVQWLVKQAVEAKSKRGDVIINHGVHQFDRRFKTSLDEKRRVQQQEVKGLAALKAQCCPWRVYRRVDGFVCGDMHEDVHCTLMEYAGHISHEHQSRSTSEKQRDSASTAAKQVSGIEGVSVAVSSDKQRMSAGALAHIIDTQALHQASANITTTFGDRLSDRDATRTSLAVAEQELIKLKEEENRLEQEVVRASELASKVREEMEELETNIETRFHMEQSVDKEMVDRLTQLTTEHDAIRERESAFKSNCTTELNRMQQQLTELTTRTAFRVNQQDAESSVNEDETHSKANRRLKDVRLQAAGINQNIALEQRRLDSVPSHIEITQYQRRIIELYNQMSAKHRETKQFYTLHNTLLDVKAYMEREIDLLNSIDDNKQLASKESYKESFIENLEHVLKGVEAILDKVSSRQKDLQGNREHLSSDYQYLLDKERTYHRTVDDFRKECQRNEEIRNSLRDAEHNVN